MEKAVVFDMDGVLVDSSARFAACLEKAGGRNREFWRCFLSDKYIHLDRPRREVAQIFREYKQRGYRVFVVSGRPLSMKAVTLGQLVELGVEPDGVFLKSKGYEVEHKVEVMRRLMRDYFIEAVFDDNPKVAEELGKLGLKVISP
ncbi:MAG: hypothetical protein N3F67_02515 [Acidilobaceae archaeon]|nr:hypothetical protein [Acidilobaceae archaeon]